MEFTYDSNKKRTVGTASIAAHRLLSARLVEEDVIEF